MTSDPDCTFNGPDKTCTNPVQDFNPDEYSVVIHSQYDSRTEYNDIALVKLKKPANIHQKNIKPICLPFHESSIKPSKSLIVIGFGLHEKSTSDRDTSNVMMKGLVNQTSNENCTMLYQNAFKSRPLTDGQFCAGGVNDKNEYVDTCKGIKKYFLENIGLICLNRRFRKSNYEYSVDYHLEEEKRTLYCRL